MESFLRTHRNSTVFVATDSPSFLAEVRARWLARWPASAFRWRDVLRAEENVAFSRRGKVSRSSNARKGEEVLLDALLLSRCDYLLHSASGVAEFAIYWNLKLHRRSVHLQYTRNRQSPPWGEREDAVERSTAVERSDSELRLGG